MPWPKHNGIVCRKYITPLIGIKLFIFVEMDIYQESLLYHKAAPNGKFSVEPTKPMDTQHDLSLAYSPGVAQPCLEIEKGLFLDFTLTLFYLELTLKFDPEIEFLHSALKFDSVISA